MADEDLNPQTKGNYSDKAVAGLDELANKDKDDESLAKWKASLGVDPAKAGEVKVEVLSFAIVSPGRDPIVFDLTDSAQVEALKNTGYTLKEKETYNVQLKFRVAGGIISGLKYINVVKKLGVRVDREERVIGSFGPSEQPHEWLSKPASVVPDGMLARGGYSATTVVADDDGNKWMSIEQKFTIAKTW